MCQTLFGSVGVEKNFSPQKSRTWLNNFHSQQQKKNCAYNFAKEYIKEISFLLVVSKCSRDISLDIWIKYGFLVSGVFYWNLEDRLWNRGEMKMDIIFKWETMDSTQTNDNTWMDTTMVKIETKIIFCTIFLISYKETI